MEENRKFPVKWLRILFYLELAGLALSLLGYLPIKKDWINWPSRVLTAGEIYCMFCMGVFYSRYKTAAIFRTIQFSISLITVVATNVIVKALVQYGDLTGLQTMNTVSFITGSVALVLGWIGTYQFYYANADLVAEKSPALEKKWRNFVWVSLGIGLATSAASYLLSRLMMAAEVGYRVAAFSGFLTNLPVKIISLIYVIYLYRTIQALKNKEEIS